MYTVFKQIPVQSFFSVFFHYAVKVVGVIVKSLGNRRVIKFKVVIVVFYVVLHALNKAIFTFRVSVPRQKVD